MDFLQAARCFSVLHRRTQLFIATACEPMGLSYLEFVLLARLYEREGASQEELAAQLFLDKAMATRTLGLLEKKGLARREKDPADLRVRRVYLTERAMEQRGRLLAVLDAWEECIAGKDGRRMPQSLGRLLERAAWRAARANLAEMGKSLAHGEN